MSSLNEIDQNYPISVNFINIGIRSVHMSNCKQIQYGCLMVCNYIFGWFKWWPGGHTLNKHLRQHHHGGNKCQSTCTEVLICIYKQTDDECFYLWVLSDLILSEFYEQ